MSPDLGTWGRWFPGCGSSIAVHSEHTQETSADHPVHSCERPTAVYREYWHHHPHSAHKHAKHLIKKQKNITFPKANCVLFLTECCFNSISEFIFSSKNGVNRPANLRKICWEKNGGSEGMASNKGCLCAWSPNNNNNFTTVKLQWLKFMAVLLLLLFLHETIEL